MTETDDPYSDAPVTLHIPVEKDVPIVREMIEDEYERIRDEYERLPAEPDTVHGEYIMRKGSLLQELLGQMNSQQ